MNTQDQTQLNLWDVLLNEAEHWVSQARAAGASTLRIWADGRLVRHWVDDPMATRSQIQIGQARCPNAKTLVLEGLKLIPQSEPYWLEGTGLQVCWRAAVQSSAFRQAARETEPKLESEQLPHADGQEEPLTSGTDLEFRREPCLVEI